MLSSVFCPICNGRGRIPTQIKGSIWEGDVELGPPIPCPEIAKGRPHDLPEAPKAAETLPTLPVEERAEHERCPRGAG